MTFDEKVETVPKVYLMCGLPGSGKSTRAAMIEREESLTRFTLDQRMISKYGIPFDDVNYGEIAAREKEAIWRETSALLAEGKGAVLDWSFWSSEQRMAWAERIRDAAAEPIVVYLDLEFHENVERLSHRNTKIDKGANHHIPIHELKRFRPFFEVPSEEEGLTIEYVRSLLSHSWGNKKGLEIKRLVRLCHHNKPY